jgi:hypothetical protein
MKVFGVIVDSFGDTDPKQMPPHFFYGARRVLYDTAQRADVSKQNYTVVPRHWYISAVIPCSECGEEFTFTASEQRFWYEDRAFYVDSFPNRCVECRKRKRALLDLKARYDASIAGAIGPCPAEQKKELIEIINSLEAAEYGLSDRMKKNRAVLFAQVAKIA